MLLVFIIIIFQSINKITSICFGFMEMFYIVASSIWIISCRTLTYNIKFLYFWISLMIEFYCYLCIWCSFCYFFWNKTTLIDEWLTYLHLDASNSIFSNFDCNRFHFKTRHFFQFFHFKKVFTVFVDFQLRKMLKMRPCFSNFSYLWSQI